jgi:hypothetical protein
MLDRVHGTGASANRKCRRSEPWSEGRRTLRAGWQRAGRSGLRRQELRLPHQLSLQLVRVGFGLVGHPQQYLDHARIMRDGGNSAHLQRPLAHPDNLRVVHPTSIARNCDAFLI